MSAAVSLPEPPPYRTCDEDGTYHYSPIKLLDKSGRKYLHSVNTPTDPTPAMLLGTLVHFLVLGPRPGAKPLVKYTGTRQGNVWKDFKAANDGAEILTAAEWAEGEAIAESVMLDPVARERLDGARLEVPLRWEEGGLTFSTSGVDIIPANMLGDLKTSTTTEPEAWTRQAFKMKYPQQLAFYRRGARANGIDVSHGLFVLGVETKAPYEVVDLVLTEDMIEYADRCVSLWLERLRSYLGACPNPKTYRDWPGYAQTPIPFDVPHFLRTSRDDEEDDA